MTPRNASPSSSATPSAVWRTSPSASSVSRGLRSPRRPRLRRGGHPARGRNPRVGGGDGDSNQRRPRLRHAARGRSGRAGDRRLVGRLGRPPRAAAAGDTAARPTDPVESAQATLRHIVYDGDAYIAEKVGGTIVVGATDDEAGFDRRVTAGGVAGLTSLAAGLFPSLAGATFRDAWVGLRPVATDRAPLIGWAPGLDGLFVATGHARNGIFLAPATAALAADLIANRSPAIDPRPFAPARFAAPPA